MSRRRISRKPSSRCSGIPSFYPPVGIGGGSQEETDFSDQASEELRLASNGDGRFQWLGGVFFSDFNSNTTSLSNYAGLEPIFGTTDLISVGEPINITQRALFGEASYKLTDQLKATLGLRYYSYSSTEEAINGGIASIAGGPGTVLEFGRADNKGFNPKVNLAYTATDDVLIYTTAAKGFRPGGPNTPVPLTGPAQCLTGPGNLQSLGLDVRAEPVQPGHCLELRGRRESARAGEHFPDQQRCLLRALDQRAAAGGSLLRLRLHGQCGHGQRVRVRDRACRELVPVLHGDPKRGTHACDVQRQRSGDQYRQGPEAPGCARRDHEHVRHLLDAGVGRLQFQCARHLHLRRSHAGHHLSCATICRATRW